MTLSEFLTQHANHDLLKLFEALADASVVVKNEVTRAGLGADILGAAGAQNVQGEEQQKLDVYADHTFIEALRNSGVVAGLASEEQEHALQFDQAPDAPYIVMIDPLDGSSNIDVNVAIGSIFAVYRRVSNGGPLTEADFLQPGKRLVAAGYFIYSASTQLVFSAGNGTHVFTLDPEDELYKVVKQHVKTPADGKVYAINEVNFDDFDPQLKRYIVHCRTKTKKDGKRLYTARYIGSLVADFHRNMLKGGIYVYPSTSEAPMGKLRLMYECNPIAFLAKQSGGLATNGEVDILDIEPADLHQRTPFYVGSPVMMQELAELK
ncbi:MAG: class 1 fructose-bisphosphatase [Salibacteraceae bacterium]